MTRPKAALFDMDGLLLDTERIAQASFLDVADAFGLEAAKAGALFLQMVGRSWADNARQLAEAMPANFDVERFRAGWNDGFSSRIAQDVPLRPHVPEVIKALSDIGATMAVVTSTATQPARSRLERVGLLSAFVTVIGGDAVEAHKPDPAPYLAGAAAVGIVPNNCVAFEDSDAGVHSATAAGCTVWQVPDLRAEGQALPDLGQGRAATLLDAVTQAGLL